MDVGPQFSRASTASNFWKDFLLESEKKKSALFDLYACAPLLSLADLAISPA